MLSKDPRLYAFRDDLADKRFETEITAQRFIQGEKNVLTQLSLDCLKKITKKVKNKQNAY